MLTTEAVITEVAYVLAASPAHQRAALIWFDRVCAAGMMRIEPVESYTDLAGIMARYASRPCDYADASLIAWAERTGISAIATIDQRDFSVYRLKGRKRFKVLLP